MLDALILSDIHLGSSSCQADAVGAFLDDLPEARRLVVNGDLLEGTEYRLGKRHWRVLSRYMNSSSSLTKGTAGCSGPRLRLDMPPVSVGSSPGLLVCNGENFRIEGSVERLAVV